MLDILYKALAFLFVLGTLIAFHEYGHFWVARKLGVKVLRYSVGFGKPLLKYQANEESPEYVLAALPLGGYVKMLDEREGYVDPDEVHLAFNRQPVWKRILIVAAGPAANLVLAVLLFAAVFMLGIPGLKPVIAGPTPASIAAEAGFREGDVVTAINAQEVRSWSDLRLILIDQSLNQDVHKIVVRDRGGIERELSLDLTGVGLLKEDTDAFGRIGLQLWEPVVPALLGEVVADGPAGKAGLRAGDEIVAFAGEDVSDWAQLVELIKSRPGQKVDLEYVREGERRASTLLLDSLETTDGVIGRMGVGLRWEGDPYADYRVTVQFGFFSSLSHAVQRTYEMSALTFKMIGKLLVGEASIKNISGPLTIADYAGKSAEIGLVFLLNFMAIVSVSLGVLNLLPVPVLDGGHLLYYVVELVKGSPVSDKAMLLGQQVGLGVLMMMMVIAFYNDIVRIVG